MLKRNKFMHAKKICGVWWVIIGGQKGWLVGGFWTFFREQMGFTIFSHLLLCWLLLVFCDPLLDENNKREENGYL